jgi:hypothetical protein
MEIRSSRPLTILLALVAVTAVAVAGLLVFREFRPEKQLQARKPSVALQFNADFDVADDGSMQVVENVVYDFRSPRAELVRVYSRPANSLLLDIDTLPHDIAITRDGQPEPFSMKPRSDLSFELRWGDPHKPLTGVHRYQLSYRIPKAWDDGKGVFSRFLISDGYDVRIDHARLAVSLPAAATTVDCSVGLSDPCDVSGTGTPDLVITAGPMPRRTGVAINAVLESAAEG